MIFSGIRCDFYERARSVQKSLHLKRLRICLSVITFPSVETNSRRTAFGAQRPIVACAFAVFIVQTSLANPSASRRFLSPFSSSHLAVLLFSHVLSTSSPRTGFETLRFETLRPETLCSKIRRLEIRSASRMFTRKCLEVKCLERTGLRCTSVRDASGLRQIGWRHSSMNTPETKCFLERASSRSLEQTRLRYGLRFTVCWRIPRRL